MMNIMQQCTVHHTTGSGGSIKKFGRKTTTVWSDPILRLLPVLLQNYSSNCNNNNRNRTIERISRSRLIPNTLQQQQYILPRKQTIVRYQHTVVYAVGEGWTGALGTGRIDQMILGHGDDDEYYYYNNNNNKNVVKASGNNIAVSWWQSFATNQSSTPVIVYDTSSVSSSNSYNNDDDDDEQTVDDTSKRRLVSCAVGWGHTALIVEETTTNKHPPTLPNTTMTDQRLDGSINLNDTTTKLAQSAETATATASTTTSTQILVTGRPHEFASLFRLQRLPRTIRNWMAYHTYNTVRRANMLERQSENDDEMMTQRTVSLNPIHMIGHTLTFLSKLFGNPNTDPNWDAARDQSYLIVPTPIPLPFDDTTTTTKSAVVQSTSDTMLPSDIDPTVPVPNDVPIHVTCSAGITAMTTLQGYVYTFGLNGIGQCGTGNPCNNVWVPSRVTGLSRQFSGVGYRATSLPQSYPIHQTCLGLQHGLCLNVAGEMFSWGKGDRGQLGNDAVENESHTAVPITKAVIMNDDYTSKIDYHALHYISQISTGMIHSAALEPETNSVYVWGKHTLPFKTDETIATSTRSNSNNPRTGVNRIVARDRVASDAQIPVRVNGLPIHHQILQIACGSHHTSILLDDGSVWCIGITTDTKRPQHHPICIIPADMIDMSTMTQFTAHMDRTTVVFGGQVIQVHLWDDPEYQRDAIFTPAWVDELQTTYPTARIREVHRSWLHTAIVADHND